MTERDQYGELDAAQALQELNDTTDPLAAIQKSVELGVRSILFYATQLQGLRDGGTSSVAKVEGDDLEYEVLVKCTRKRQVILLGE